MKVLAIGFLLASIFESGISAPCSLDSSISSEEVPFDTDIKLEFIGFDASINYITLSPGMTPYAKITSASEEPTIDLQDGVLTISTSTCEGGEEGSSAASYLTGALACLSPRRMGPLFLLGSLLGSFSGAMAQDTCTPSLTIDIALPLESTVSSKFGDTDHVLEANVDTVVWGYYDSNATALLTMQSGETITVEVITHHASHEYSKMIKGDPAVEAIFAWEAGTSITEKAEPKFDGTGVHLITGPIGVAGAMPGDVIQVDILELDPRPNPATGKTFGTNSQKFAGYQFRADGGTKRDGTPYVRSGGTEAITVFEFIADEDGNMLYGKPCYMYTFPNFLAPDGSNRTFDNNPAMVVPLPEEMGCDGEMLGPVTYPEGFNDYTLLGDIEYLNPDPALLDWQIPLRPHLGTLAVMPAASANYNSPSGGANTIPPANFGGNIDDWRIGKGGTMYYVVEKPEALLIVGDTHAAQGDSELAGTAMETSMTAKLRVTLHKQDSLPKKVSTLYFPLLETADKFIVHGFAYGDYLTDDAINPDAKSEIFADGATLDLAMEDAFLKTRNWLMDVYDLIEEETIALMTTSVDFGVTQVVDGNWGVHADIPKWVFDKSGAPYDYSCTTSKGPGRRRDLHENERQRILAKAGVFKPTEELADELYHRITKECASCKTHYARRALADTFLDLKMQAAKNLMVANGEF